MRGFLETNSQSQSKSVALSRGLSQGVPAPAANRAVANLGMPPSSRRETRDPGLQLHR